MPRRRVAVALLLPEPLATEVDGLRRALGDPQLDRVVPHITLVPPVNVRVEELPAALRVLRGAASTVAGPLVLTIGPAATFEPVAPVVYLAVGGDDGDQLGALRDRLLVAPLDRRIDHAFVPHVTVADEHPRRRIPAAVDALRGFEVTTPIERLHLLADDAPGGRRWNPVADVPFGPSVIVGRGGWELEVTVSELGDPEVTALLGGEMLVPAGGRAVVAAARHDGALLAALRGWERDGEVTIDATAGAPDALALLEARV